MLRFLINLVRRKAAVGSRLTAAPDSSPEWNRDDALAFKNFLSNPTGKAFIARYQARVLNITSTACMKQPAYDGKVYTPDEAAGICHDFNWLISLSCVPQVQRDNLDTQHDSPENVGNDSVNSTH